MKGLSIMSAFRAMCLTASIFFVCAVGIPGVHADTVAMWLFDDPPGSTVAVDSSGNGYDLTLGPDAAIVEGGKFGRALDCDATLEDGLGAFRYGAEKALNPGDEDWTLECWVRAKPELKDDNRIWGLSGVNYIDYGRGNEYTSSRVTKFFEGNHRTDLQVATQYMPLDSVLGWNKPTGDLTADHAFHHMAVVYDSGAKELRHYFNGKHQFTVKGVWHEVHTGEEPYKTAGFPPHYPMLQVGMRDAIQQWDHHELEPEARHFEKLEGWIDEMRFSDEALYTDGFAPPGSLAKPFLRVWPETVSVVVDAASGRIEAPVLEISALGGQPIEWRLTENIEGISVDQTEGEASKKSRKVTLKIDKSALGTERRDGTIEIEAPGAMNSPVRVKVALTVLDSAAVRDIGNRNQLFIDRRFIESSDNVELHINPPEKFQIEFDRSKNSGGEIYYPLNAFFDEDRGRYRMYYYSGPAWCMESDDGVNWEHVEQNGGMVTLEGLGENGLPLRADANGNPYHMFYAPPVDGVSGARADFPMIVYDPHDAPERRYKAFHELSFAYLDGDGYEVKSNEIGKDWRKLTGVYGYYSADGVHFKAVGKRLLPVLPEGLFGAYWDDKTEKYFVYTRCQNMKPGGIASMQGCQFIYRPGFEYSSPESLVSRVNPDLMQAHGYENLRSIARLETDNLLEPWIGGVAEAAEENTLYATSSDLNMVLHADPWDGFKDFYSSYPIKYPYAEDVHLLFVQTLRHFHPSRQPWFPAFADLNGPLQSVLAVSRDGQHWERVDRTPYVPLGLMDEFDRHRTVPGGGMIRVGSYLYRYYWGNPRIHDTKPLRDEYAEIKPEWTNVGMAGTRQRIDGFVSADTNYKGGWLTTPPIRFSGKRLVINQDCGGQGMMFVELRDANDRPIPGYTLADCEEITCNDVAWEVRWRGKADVSALAGRPIKLHFRMTDARLFAFQFDKGQDS